MPLRASVQTNATVAAVLFQPLTFGVGVIDVETIGAVRSILSVRDAVAILPALSRVVPDTDWPAPSVASVVTGGQVSMPLSASLQVNVTLMVPLFQPAASGSGAAAALIVGTVLSTLTDTETVVVFPALSRAVPVTT